MLANQIQQYIKKDQYHVKLDSFQGHTMVQYKQIKSMWYTTSTKGQKPHDYLKNTKTALDKS